MKSLARKLSVIAPLNGVGSDCRGSVSIMMGLAAIPVALAAGVAIDFVRADRAQTELQNLADAASLAAAAGQNISGTTAEKIAQRKAIAQSYLDLNFVGFTDGTMVGSPEIIVGPNTVDVNIKANIVGSLINATKKKLDDPVKVKAVSASSKAAFSNDSYLCLLATHMTQPEAIYFQGNSEFTASVCTVQANSDATVAMRTWGTAYAEAEAFCSVGGWAGSSFNPDPENGCTAKLDPYVSLAMPTVGSCDYNNMQVKNETATLNPGVYCGGLDVRTHGVANLNPGLYVIKDGDLNVDSQSTLNAIDGVVFYITGSTSNIDITSGAEVTINAPRSGEGVGEAANYEGFAIIHDRTTGIGNTDYISSGGDVNINGAFYGPNVNLKVWANGDMNAASSYFPIIANTFEMNGDATLHVRLDYAAAGYEEPVDLKVEGKVLLTQ